MIPATEENIYRVLWHARGLLIDRIVATGETGLARVLALFHAHSRRFELQLATGETVDATGKVAKFFSGGGAWHPRPTDAGRHPPCTALPGGVPLYAWTKVAGTNAILPTHGSYDYLVTRHVVDLARQRAFDAIVELGSGIGERLFEVYLSGGPRGIPYYGAEVWETGRAVADRLAALEPGLDFRSVPFDMHTPDFSFLRGHRRVLLFSNAAICCVEHLPLAFVEGMAGAAPSVVGVHYELISHQFQAAPSDRYSSERNLNRDFMGLLKLAQGAGTIGIDYLGPDLYTTSSAQSMTVIQWATRAP